MINTYILHTVNRNSIPKEQTQFLLNPLINSNITDLFFLFFSEDEFNPSEHKPVPKYNLVDKQKKIKMKQEIINTEPYKGHGIKCNANIHNISN